MTVPRMPRARLAQLAQVPRLLFTRIDATDHRRRRLLAMAQGVVTNLGNRLIGLLVAFLSVPLTIGYLGAERYGIWITLGSLLAWMQLTDFGLGMGLTNAVTTAAGQDRPELVRTHVSNATLLLSAIAAIVGVATVALWPFIDWNALFGVQGAVARAQAGPAIAVAIAIFLLQFPFSVAAKVYMAYQEGRIGNYWTALGNLLSLAALLAVTRTQGGLVWLVVALSGTSLLVNVASSAWLFLRHRPALRPHPRAIDVSRMRGLGHASGQFFLIQIMALVTFSSDNFVVSHFLGAGRVPEYSLTYNLFNYTSLPQTILFSYLWTAYNEAIARGDIAWVRRSYHLNLFLGLGFTLVAVAVLYAIAPPFITWWSRGAVTPGMTLVLWMGAWSVVNAMTNPVACLLAAAGRLRYQIMYSALATAANIALSLSLVRGYGPAGVIAATVLSYAVFVCAPIYIDARLLLRKLAAGR